MDNIKDSIIKDLDQGYNCAQALLRQYSPEFHLGEDLALRITSGFGGGMRMGKTCGAVTGGIMVLGLAFGFGLGFEPSAKDNIQHLTVDFLDRFRAIYGTTDCKEILGIDTSIPGNREIAKEQGLFQTKCPACIFSAIDIIGELRKA